MSNLSGFVKRIRDIMRNDPGINGDAQRIEQISWMLFLKVYDAKEQDWMFDDEGYESIIPENCRWGNWAHDDKSGKALTGDALMNFVNNTLFPMLKELPVDNTTPLKKAIVKTTFADANNYMKDGVLLRQVINVIDDLQLDDYEESHAFGEIYETILKELQSAGSAGEYYTPRAVTDFMARMINPQIGEKMADFACGTGGFITSWLKVLKEKIQTTEDAELYAHSIYGIEKKQFPYMLCITNMLLHDLDIPEVYHDNTLLRDVLDYTDDDKVDVVLMNPPYGGNEKSDVKNHFPADLASSETADLFMSVIMYRLKVNGRAAVILPDAFLYGVDNAKVNIKKKLLSEFNLHTIIRMPGSVFSPYTPITTNILFFDNTGKTEKTWFYRLDMPEGYKHFSKTKPMKLEHFAPVIEWWNDRKTLSVDGRDKARCFTYDEMTVELGYNLGQCGFPHEEEEILEPLDLIQKRVSERSSLNKIFDNAIEHIKSAINGSTPPETLFSKGVLTSLVEIESSFAEDIKKSVLQMAIQGKLVEQRSADGTAVGFIEKLKTAKKELIRIKAIRAPKNTSVSEKTEDAFDIPDSWSWVEVGDCVSNRSGLAYDKGNLIHKTDTMIRVLRGGNILDMAYVIKTDDVMISKEFVKSDLFLKRNTIITPAVTSMEHVGKMGRIESNYTDMVVGGFVLMLIPHIDDDVFSKYLLYTFSSQYFRDCCRGIVNKSGQAFYNLSREKLMQLRIPIPPYDEQKRIVDKLEKILPLCERLK